MLDSVVDFYVEVRSILPTVFHFAISEAVHLVLKCGSGENFFTSSLHRTMTNLSCKLSTEICYAERTHV
jgi:hypothetical protein